MNIEKLPKVELHCHLDGSVRPSTIIDIAKEEGIALPSYDVESIKKEVVCPIECKSLKEYLKRFDIPNKIMQSRESLKRIAFELYEDAAKENVKYMEVRFAPQLHMEKGLDIKEVIESVISGVKAAEEKFDIKGNVIITCMRTMPVYKAFEVVEAGREFLGKGVVAIDIASEEEAGFAEKFVEPVELARKYGYRITIHAGEAGCGENVLDAVELLGAERIGHGIYIKDCFEAYKIVKDMGVPLEICPTSNVQTKAVQSFKDHPIGKFYKDGIKVTINTDNRTVSDTTMTKEIEIVLNEFKLTLEDYKQIYLYSVDAAFTDEKTKEWLKSLICI